MFSREILSEFKMLSEQYRKLLPLQVLGKPVKQLSARFP